MYVWFLGGRAISIFTHFFYFYTGWKFLTTKIIILFFRLDAMINIKKMRNIYEGSKGLSQLYSTEFSQFTEFT